MSSSKEDLIETTDMLIEYWKAKANEISSNPVAWGKALALRECADELCRVEEYKKSKLVK